MELTNTTFAAKPFGSTVGIASRGLAMAAYGSSSMSSQFGVPTDDLTPFEREKAAFRRKRQFLHQYAGQFVAIHEGQVAAYGRSMKAVLETFFADHAAGTSVYIGFVGRMPVARVSAPIFLRRR